MGLMSPRTDSADKHGIYHHNQIKLTQINQMHLVVCVTAKMIVIKLNYRQFTEVPEAWGILDGGDTDFFVGAPA